MGANEGDYGKKPMALVSSFLAYIREGILRILPQVISILVAFLVGAFVLLATGYSPLEAYATMLKGAFGDIIGIGQTFTQATPA